MSTLDSRKRWLALLILCLGDLMIVLEVTIVGVALPSQGRPWVLGELARLGRERLPDQLRGSLLLGGRLATCSATGACS